MPTTSVHQPTLRTGAAVPSITARVTRVVVVWAVVGALLDELSDLRTGRSGR